jgi:hypothetical protein
MAKAMVQEMGFPDVLFFSLFSNDHQLYYRILMGINSDYERQNMISICRTISHYLV